jgi:hypothetical protein
MVLRFGRLHIVLVFLIVFSLLLWPVFRGSNSSTLCTLPPVPMPSDNGRPCFPSSVASEDIAFWSSKWEESLQRGNGVLPADLSFDTESLRQLNLKSGETVHITSYQLWRGHGLSNWAAWLRSSKTEHQLIAFVPTAEIADHISHTAKVASLAVAVIGSLLDPFVLCQRDLGSGMKVRAVLELLRRGLDVWYSDADVLWMKQPPSSASLEPKADLAIQIYGNGDGVATGDFGMNFGLFFARGSSQRLRDVMRRLFRAMTRSFVVHEHGGLDTCNDQNCFNALLMRWFPELVCGWFFRGQYYARTRADAEQCIVLQLLDPRHFAMADRLGSDYEEMNTLHMTTYKGGHTFGKIFALQEHGLWRGIWSVPDPDARLLLLMDKDCSEQQLRDALALALLSRRVLLLPRRMKCRGPAKRACHVETLFDADRLLTCNRAMMGHSGYWSWPDKLTNCTECERCVVVAGNLFVFLTVCSTDLRKQCQTVCLQLHRP